MNLIDRIKGLVQRFNDWLKGSVNDRILCGFVYTIEHLRADGTLVDREVVHNLIPLEGLNFILSSEFKGASVPATWFLGLYQGNYTPSSSDTAAAFPGNATECTTYSQATRGAFVPGTPAGGALDNSASPASFTFTTAQTVYGGFMSSASAKGAVTGTLFSAVRFASPKSPNIGDILNITAGFTFASS